MWGVRPLAQAEMHSTEQYTNNRAGQSHEATRVAERVMRKAKSTTQAQIFSVLVQWHRIDLVRGGL